MTTRLSKARGFGGQWWYLLSDGALHLGAVAALWHFTWSGVVVMLALMWFCGLFGITLGYHRLLTHASFKTYPWIRRLLAVIGCCVWQGGPVEWVGTHRLHHAKADREGDPHTPRDGLLWAHMWWVMTPLGFDPAAYAKDLLRDPWLRLIDRFFWVPPLALFGLLYLLGHAITGAGLSWLLWGGCMRSVVSLHSGWIVNSWTHRWGYRNFQTADDSRNSRFVGLLTFGEGFHNNHHAQQRSAAHGMFRGEPDLTYTVILLMERLGLAWDVVHPDLSQRSTGKAAAAATPQRASVNETFGVR